MSGPPDHVGFDLIRAAEAWEKEFRSRMVDAGYPLFAEARGRLIRHIGRDGIDQARLVALSGMTKQAVQKHLVALEADGVLTRQATVGDGRARRIMFTDEGMRMIAHGDRIKGEIEARMIGVIGPQAFADLRRALRGLRADRQQG